MMDGHLAVRVVKVTQLFGYHGYGAVFFLSANIFGKFPIWEVW